MIRKPIYEPTGAAREYGDLAVNIYTGCPHGCEYCFAPAILRKSREEFHNKVEPRLRIVESVYKQVEREKITGKLIHLCFTCDPYPEGVDTTPTRNIIKILKSAGNHVQILTKSNNGSRDFDLLDHNDLFGVTITGGWLDCEPQAAPEYSRLVNLLRAHEAGIKTWVSCEPVLNEDAIYSLIADAVYQFIDVLKIGKLNHCTLEKLSGGEFINWHEFGHKVERLCKRYNRNYYIKDALRREMEATN